MKDGGSTGFARFIGRRLAQERLLAGKSREELAKMVGVSGRAIEQYERGERRMTPARLVAAAAVLGVPLSFLFYDGDRHGASGDDWEAVEPRRLGVCRPPQVLDQPGFRCVAPIVKLWREQRGELTDDANDALIRGGIRHRMYLMRGRQESSRLVIEWFAYGVAHVLPCESLSMMGRGPDEMHDREYGAWAAEHYAEALWSRDLRVHAARALIRTSTGATLQARYDRVLLPWRRRRDDLVMGISLGREVLRSV